MREKDTETDRKKEDTQRGEVTYKDREKVKFTKRYRQRELK